MIKGEDILRIEHKLDAVIAYLKAMTGEAPLPMPKKVPGLSTMTNGVCPITDTPIHYTIDVSTGQPRRKDGLHSGMTETGPISSASSFKSNSVMMGKGNLDES